MKKKESQGVADLASDSASNNREASVANFLFAHFGKGRRIKTAKGVNIA